jgi:hypothetical protein
VSFSLFKVSLRLAQVSTAAALLGALMLVPAPARAQDDVTLTMARERFKEGVGYFDKKDFAKARVAFLQAYALKKHPAVLLNLAQSELRSGHEADAAKHFAQYLREHKDATDAERQGAETGLTASKALVAEVALDVDTNAAEVYIDGDLEGTTPLPGPIYLAPGSHELQARKDGKTTSGKVTAAAGQSTSMTLKLGSGGKTTPAPAPAAEGGAAPAAEAGTEPPPEEPAPTAHHRKKFIPWVTSTPGAMIGVGLTGVGLIGGGAFAFGSKSAYDAADSVAAQIGEKAVTTDGKVDGKKGACTNPAAWLRQSTRWMNATDAEINDRASQYVDNCNKYTNNVKSGDTFKKVAIVSFAVAGAAAVGTIIYYIADSGSGDDESAQAAGKRRVLVMPLYQPGFAGGFVTGTF